MCTLPPLASSRPAKCAASWSCRSRKARAGQKNSPGSIVEIDAVQRGDVAVALDDAAERDLAEPAHRRPTSLDRADGKAFDDVALREHAEQDHRRHGDHRGGGDAGPLRLFDRDEVEHGDRDLANGVAAEHDGEQELVPGVEEHEDTVTAMPPRDLRQDDVQKARSRPARSISAASSISRGMSSKYETSSQIANGKRERQIDQRQWPWNRC